MSDDRLFALAPTLEAFQNGTINASDLAWLWRDAAHAHEPALPERYLEILERVLNQLESGALFTEESCSFSQTELIGALRDWLKHAKAL